MTAHKDAAAYIQCPRDKRKLEPFLFHGELAHLCAECHGLWLPASFFEGVQQRKFEGKPYVLPGVNKMPMRHHVRIKCLADQTPMNVREKLGIQIDFCPTCRGVWLDGGELEQIIKRQKLSPNTPRLGAPPLTSDIWSGGAGVAADVVGGAIEIIFSVLAEMAS